MEEINSEIAHSADRYAIDVLGIPSLELMQNASEAVCRHIPETGKIFIAAGVGNNGGDGACIASILKLQGRDVTLCICGNMQKGSWEFYRQLSEAKRNGVKILFYGPDTHLEIGREDILVDAVFGTGLSREVGGIYKNFLSGLALLKPALTVAVDIPSGINTDNGEVMGTALPADITVTFGKNKIGLTRGDGAKLSGRVFVEDIGIPEKVYKIFEK